MPGLMVSCAIDSELEQSTVRSVVTHGPRTAAWTGAQAAVNNKKVTDKQWRSGCLSFMTSLSGWAFEGFIGRPLYRAKHLAVLSTRTFWTFLRELSPP